MTTDLALLGLCAGLGLVLVLAGVTPPRTSLKSEMRRYDPSSMLAGGAEVTDAASVRSALVTIGSALDGVVASLTRASRSPSPRPRSLRSRCHSCLQASCRLRGGGSRLAPW
jgi:hypothetical protein